MAFKTNTTGQYRNEPMHKFKFQNWFLNQFKGVPSLHPNETFDIIISILIIQCIKIPTSKSTLSFKNENITLVTLFVIPHLNQIMLRRIMTVKNVMLC